jgi:hypothetical protein
MPDISMCMNKECKSKNQCFRYRALPNEHRQAYMEFKPAEGHNSCESFMDIQGMGAYRLKPIGQ